MKRDGSFPVQCDNACWFRQARHQDLSAVTGSRQALQQFLTRRAGARQDGDLETFQLRIVAPGVKAICPGNAHGVEPVMPQYLAGAFVIHENDRATGGGQQIETVNQSAQLILAPVPYGAARLALAYLDRLPNPVAKDGSIPQAVGNCDGVAPFVPGIFDGANPVFCKDVRWQSDRGGVFLQCNARLAPEIIPVFVSCLLMRFIAHPRYPLPQIKSREAFAKSEGIPRFRRRDPVSQYRLSFSRCTNTRIRGKAHAGACFFTRYDPIRGFGIPPKTLIICKLISNP